MVKIEIEREVLMEVIFFATGFGRRKGFLMPLVINEDGDEVLGLSDGNSAGQDDNHQDVILGIFKYQGEFVDGLPYFELSGSSCRHISDGMESQCHELGDRCQARHHIGQLGCQDWQLVARRRNDKPGGYPDWFFETTTGDSDGLSFRANHYLGKFYQEVIKYLKAGRLGKQFLIVQRSGQKFSVVGEFYSAETAREIILDSALFTSEEDEEITLFLFNEREYVKQGGSYFVRTDKTGEVFPISKPEVIQV